MKEIQLGDEIRVGNTTFRSDIKLHDHASRKAMPL